MSKNKKPADPGTLDISRADDPRATDDATAERMIDAATTIASAARRLAKHPPTADHETFYLGLADLLEGKASRAPNEIDESDESDE